MALLDSLIVSACMGLPGQTNDACQKALTAASKQSGIERSTGNYEESSLKHLQSGAEGLMGKDAVAAIGGVGWAAKSAVERKASFGLPNFGFCNSIKFELNSNVERLIFQWKF